MPVLTSRRLMTLAFGGALLMSALPAGWFAPWSPWLADAVWMPLRPAMRGLASVQHSVRAPDDPYPARPEELRAALEERDRLSGELDAERLRNETLESQLRELSGVWEDDQRGGWRPVLGALVARGSDSGSASSGLLDMSVGAGQGVREGDPVVTGGNRLVGLVTGPVRASQCWVVPLDDRRAGRIDALVYPASKPNAGPRDATLVQLVPQGKGRLVGELESGSTVQTGDAVRLSDPSWRSAAQGMLIGLVERVGTLDANPLRTRIEVRMPFDPQRLSQATVKVQDATAPARRAPRKAPR